MMDDVIQIVTVYALPVIFAITLHEAAHGYVARFFGDPTAQQAGRVSLNPMRHVDPMGTLLVPALILLASRLMGGGWMLFGWAKPVPVNFGRLRRPKQDMLWVALAGPAANLLMALAWVMLLRVLIEAGIREGFWLKMGVAGINVNLTLMALNLLPVPPLDGGRIVFSLLPQGAAYRYARLEPYGMVIVLALLATGTLWVVMAPVMALGNLMVSWFL
jgi:Zn-dependent protease